MVIVIVPYVCVTVCLHVCVCVLLLDLGVYKILLLRQAFYGWNRMLKVRIAKILL